MTYNIKTGKEKILRIWIPIIRHGCSGNEVLPSSFLAATSGHYLSREGGRGVLPYRRLMGMYRWMGSHFHDWIDYNGVAFSIELLEWGHIFSDFGG